jgi:hypothetical protein
MTPEMPINVPSRHTSYLASSSPLSSLPPSELPDTMPQIEEEIGNDTDEKGSDGEDGEMEIDDEMGDTHASKQSRDRKYYNKRRKLQTVVNALHGVGWRLDHFLRAWIQDAPRGQDLTLEHRLYVTPSHRRKALQEALETIEQPVLLHDSTFTTEFEALINTHYFGRFDHTAEVDTIDFDAAFRSVKTAAPTWHRMLVQVLSNSRASRSSYTASKDLRRMIFVITSIVCHSRAKKRSTYLSTMLDAYLIGSGVKRQVIETLAGFGLCHSYKQGNRLMSQVAQHEKV